MAYICKYCKTESKNHFCQKCTTIIDCDCTTIGETQYNSLPLEGRTCSIILKFCTCCLKPTSVKAELDIFTPGELDALLGTVEGE